ncbi:hypothetical protein B0H21DRAFT_557417 [Amylocystis lapponica]|nr:hypothetical protein B0H21DRAFT_557417 [Amylocystis lapponica]
MTLPLVLIVGATGNTGRVIVKALAKSGNFKVAALVRPASVTKPVVNEFRAAGVEIREGDIETDTVDKLKAVLSGADTLISTVDAASIGRQRSIITAAKEAGVKRVIPCDFATPGARGLRALMDDKLDIHDFVKSLGVGYTFIDVGWWQQISLPLALDSESPLAPLSYELYGNGKQKFLVTDLERIGDYVARIIADERTLNQYVIIWDNEVTQEEAKEIGERASGGGEALKAKRVPVSAEDLLARAAVMKEEYSKSHSAVSHMMWAWAEYQLSIHVKGENTLENAKALGALNVRELYPDIVPETLEDFAERFYKGGWSYN